GNGPTSSAEPSHDRAAAARLRGAVARTARSVFEQLERRQLMAATVTHLSDLSLNVVANGYGPAERDTSNGDVFAKDGKALKLNGVTYQKGLGVHANSEVRVNLAGNYNTFVSDVGIDDSASPWGWGSATFQVWADNTKLYDSGKMTGDSATKSVSVDVTGKKELRLVVTDAGDGQNYDHADWAGAKLLAGEATGGGGTTPENPPPPLPPPPPPVGQVGTGDGLKATYYDNVDFTGKSLARVDAIVNHNWGQGSPDASMAPDTFSAVWTGQVQAQFTETHTFHLTSDDGVRLFVNGQKLVDNWTDHAPTENAGSIALVASNKYDIRIEYYERGGQAVSQLRWSSPSTAKQIVPKSQLYSNFAQQPPTEPPPGNGGGGSPNNGTGDGLRAIYWDNQDFTGKTVSRIDKTIDNSWGQGSPDGSIAPDTFSARWTGQIQARYSETYTFSTLSDDGVRLWINGQLIINNWTDHAPTINKGTIALEAGKKYDFKLEYFEAHGGADMRLWWESASQKSEIVPTSQLYSGFVAPSAPSGLAASAVSAGQINLSWADNSNNENGFVIERSGNGSTGWAQVATVGTNVTSYSDKGLVGSTQYYYRVRATNEVGTSAWSNPADATTPAGTSAPAAPSKLWATADGLHKINLKWADNSSNESGFRIERSKDGQGGWATVGNVGQNGTTFTDAGLTPDTNYVYRVVALGQSGASSSDASYPIIANTLGIQYTNHAEPTRTGGWSWELAPNTVWPDSGKRNNIFYVGEQVSFRLGAAARKYEVRDYEGNLVASGNASALTNLGVTQPGWYKLYLFGDQTTAQWGDVVGATTFVIFRDDPNFPKPPPSDEFLQPVLTRTDAMVNFDWGNGSPAAGVPDEGFGIRWTGQVMPRHTETYHFHTIGDDGVRLWVNGQLLVDDWVAHAPKENTGSITLEAGKRYDIRMEYFDRYLGATAKLLWSSASQAKEVIPTSRLFTSAGASTPTGLTGQYFKKGYTEGSEDPVARGVTGMGPQRHFVVDASNPDEAIKRLEDGIALDKIYYLDHAFNGERKLLVAFMNGTQNLDGVKKIVAHFKDAVKYWEPRNEPNFTYSGGDFARGEMKQFYQAVHSVDPTAKVIGPGIVTITQGYGLGWMYEFLAAGGGQYIDGFSFHAYSNVNGDLELARVSMDGLMKMLAQYGLQDIELWQTEQGSFAANYGGYTPRVQGRWVMLQRMVFEQYGIPKEQDHVWYDRSHGFWDMPTWWVNEDGSFNPAAALMRVYSEETFGTTFAKAFDFGDPGNDLYVGNLFTGPGKSVAAFMSAGSTDGKVTLTVNGGNGTLKLVSSFGVVSTVSVINGRATIDVPEVPVYVEMQQGQTIDVVKTNYGKNLARQPGATATSPGNPAEPATGDVSKVINGKMESWYITQQSGSGPYGGASVTPDKPDWVTINLAGVQTVDRVVVYAAPPWQHQASLIDFEIQINDNGQWVTAAHVQEDPRTFGSYMPANRTTADSFYSDRWVFNVELPEAVQTDKVRILARDTTYGGASTAVMRESGAMHGKFHQMTLREVEIYDGGAT
ncbi:MAG: PA14 domain-containing protein, partial [Tepidisphaeraceae bacterium]